MTHSKISRLRKFMNKEVYTDDQTGEKYLIAASGFSTVDAPPLHVGKQFPYQNARRALEAGLEPDAIAKIDAPHKKDALQLEREAAYLGRNKHQLESKPPTHNHGGNGTIRRSSMRKPFRDLSLHRAGHSVMKASGRLNPSLAR